MMRTLRIFDTDPASGHLLGLDRLLSVLLRLGLVAASDTWFVTRGAWGHGAWICELEDGLMGRAGLDVSPSDLLSALEKGEYFYDVAITFSSDPSIQAGLVDSAFLFVHVSESAIAAVAREFTSTEVVIGG